MIGRLGKPVIDCPDSRALAEFYCQVLGKSVDEDTDGWVVIGSGPGQRQLAFQRAAHWAPPRWPDPAPSGTLGRAVGNDILCTLTSPAALTMIYVVAGIWC